MQNAISITPKLLRDAIPIAPKPYVRDAISIAPKLYMRSQSHEAQHIIPRLQLPSQPWRARRLLRVIRRRRRVATRQRNPKPPRIPRTLIRSGERTRSAIGVARKDILPQRALSNRSATMTISRFTHPSWPAMQWQQSRSP